MSLDRHKPEPPRGVCKHAAWRSLDREVWPVNARRNEAAEKSLGTALVLDTPTARWVLRLCKACSLYAVTFDAREARP